MIQIITALVIILIVGGVIVLNREKISILKLTLASIFLAIAVIVSYFSVPMMFVGSQVVIRFSQLILMVLGGALGPLYALIGGIGYDVLNLLTRPLGSYYVGFTLNNILVTLIPALMFKYFRKRNEKVTFSLLTLVSLTYLVYIVTVLLLFLNVGSVDNLDASNLAKNGLIFMAVFIAVVLIALFVIKMKKIELKNDWMILVISAILVEFLIQGFLTPLWLSDMSQTPILISMQIRALKGIPMIAINTFLGYPLYKLVSKNLSKDSK